MHSYTAILSSEAKEAIKALSRNFDVLMLPPDSSIDKPVSCHADMILFSLGCDAVLPNAYAFSYPEIPSYLESVLGLAVKNDLSERHKSYPYDIGLNVLLNGSYAFGNAHYISDNVKNILEKYSIELLHVRQGYSACSSLSFGNCIITADKGIADSAEERSIDVLRITPGHIRLEGYSYGFIGGASGVHEDCVYFSGNIERHPDGKKIRRFVESSGFECISLYDGDLSDIGGIKFLRNVI